MADTEQNDCLCRCFCEGDRDGHPPHAIPPGTNLIICAQPMWDSPDMCSDVDSANRAIMGQDVKC